MKHIKTFELVEFNSLYDVGDYVYADENFYTDHKPRLGKIVENDNSQVPYRILISNGDSFWILVDMISRKLTDDEIEQYELESTADKYNL